MGLFVECEMQKSKKNRIFAVAKNKKYHPLRTPSRWAKRQRIMNKTQRRLIANICDVLQGAIDDLRNIVEQEEEKLDNMPENLWDSERYEMMDSEKDDIEQIADELENTLDELQGHTESQLWETLKWGF